MRIAVILNSPDQESLNNALRFSLVALEEGNQVALFAMGRGVEALSNPDAQNLTLMQEVLSRGGKIVA